MARAVKKPLGGVRGRVGDVIYRYMNGRTFVSVYNGEVKISQTEESKNNRSKFGTTIKFAKAVNSVSGLNKIWNFSSEPGRSAYTKIFKYNHYSIQSDFVSPYCNITPTGAGFSVESFELNVNNITIKIKIDRSAEQRLLPPYNAHFVVFLSQPVNTEIQKNIAFAFASEIVSSETPDEAIRNRVFVGYVFGVLGETFDAKSKAMFLIFSINMMWHKLASKNGGDIGSGRCSVDLSFEFLCVNVVLFSSERFKHNKAPSWVYLTSRTLNQIEFPIVILFKFYFNFSTQFS